MAQQQNNSLSSQDSSASGHGLYDRAKEAAGKVYDAVSERASETFDEQKSSLSDGLNDISDGIRRTGDDMNARPTDNPISTAAAEYSSAAADIVSKISGYFQRKDPREMLHDAEDLARRNPVVFVAAAFGLGVLAARFLKSSPRSLEARAGRAFGAASAAETPSGDLPERDTETSRFDGQ